MPSWKYQVSNTTYKLYEQCPIRSCEIFRASNYEIVETSSIEYNL